MLYFMQIGLSHTPTHFHRIGIKKERQIKCQSEVVLKNKTKCLACTAWQFSPPVRHFTG